MEELVQKLCTMAFISLALLTLIMLFAIAEITLIEFIREKIRLRKEMKVWKLSKIIYNLDTHSNERCQKCGKWRFDGNQCTDICFSIETARYLMSKGVRVKGGKK